MLKIDKGIKMPERTRGSKWDETIKAMKVGDSVLLAGKKGVFSFLAQARRLGLKMSSRTVGNDSRIWMVSSEKTK